MVNFIAEITATALLFQKFAHQRDVPNFHPAISSATKRIPMAELRELKEQNRDQIAEFVGMAPICEYSGTHGSCHDSQVAVI